MKIARTTYFWFIWAVVVLVVLWWFAFQAAGAHIWTVKPAVRSPKAEELAVPCRIPLPRFEVIPKPPADVEFFAATAFNADGESDFSNEISYSNAANQVWLLLAWDPSASTNVSGYRIYAGWATGNYDRRYEAGTNLSIGVPFYGYPLTNRVITVTTTNADFLQYRDGLKEPWYSIPTNYWRATNPPAPRFFRAGGDDLNSRVFIHVQQQ